MKDDVGLAGHGETTLGKIAFVHTFFTVVRNEVAIRIIKDRATH